MRTLIVEDSVFFRQILRETLQSHFPAMEIIEAVNGQEVMQKIDTLRPELVFMDIKLPGGENGLELTRNIKTRHPGIQVLILTSYDLPEYREAASRCGANYFLSKGTTTKDQILTLVRSLLSEKKDLPPSDLSP
jgi:DNA-binding NarL/FixJ family response regulator